MCTCYLYFSNLCGQKVVQVTKDKTEAGSSFMEAKVPTAASSDEKAAESTVATHLTRSASRIQLGLTTPKTDRRTCSHRKDHMKQWLLQE